MILIHSEMAESPLWKNQLNIAVVLEKKSRVIQEP